MAERRAAAGPSTAASGHVRIIGGSLRGSRLPVADRAGLRPSSDRVRETLFNWLQPLVGGARCLDAFAGTGVLGLEASSRGAASVLLLERDAALAASLRAQAERLRAQGVRVECTDALQWLRQPAQPRFDIAFLDPPFAAALWQPAVEALRPWLAPGAHVYVESPPELALDAPGWDLHREGRTREVRYALYRVIAGAAA